MPSVGPCHTRGTRTAVPTCLSPRAVAVRAHGLGELGGEHPARTSGSSKISFGRTPLRNDPRLVHHAIASCVHHRQHAPACPAPPYRALHPHRRRRQVMFLGQHLPLWRPRNPAAKRATDRALDAAAPGLAGRSCTDGCAPSSCRWTYLELVLFSVLVAGQTSFCYALCYFFCCRGRARLVDGTRVNVENHWWDSHGKDITRAVNLVCDWQVTRYDVTRSCLLACDPRTHRKPSLTFPNLPTAGQ